MYSQLTWPILAQGVIRRALPTDYSDMHGPILIFYGLFWATLMRTLLVRARVLPPTCARCGLPHERRRMGERVCSCHADEA